MNEFAKRLSKAMSYRNVTQSELVEKTGITKGAISQYLKGEYEPKQNNIYKLSKALNINPVWLMGKDIDMEITEEKRYYLDEEVRKLAQELFERHELRILFDATKKVKPEDIKFVQELVERLKQQE